ncbi:hypothetical protein CLOSTMETH_00753 [[Clostridium] methylpentosum DSM 5476]|uniref:Uncharacterized protein n=1 Tax=[Clostridium] methylpentosum DSM 5476 TaxID=537013 RepID=C0EA99_9FIRM|nr:hypothetical protein CLOSTMETH_00753 [[Clostridium] methylpentosum DSM 5476]
MRAFFCLYYRHQASFEPLAQRVVFFIQKSGMETIPLFLIGTGRRSIGGLDLLG